MAMLNSYDSKLRNAPLPKPLMLKDYLLDDLSSCSSSGFRSYPRRQCCTTLRFFLEIDLKCRDSNQRKSVLKSKSTNVSSTMSAFHRASEAVINAVKLLPFAAIKSSSKKSNNKNSILPRSFSLKLLKRSFWKKTDKEIERWKSFQYLLEENEKPSVVYPSDAARTATTTTGTDTNSSLNESNSNSNSNSNSDSNSWSDSDVTSDYLQCSSGNSEGSCGNDVVEDKWRLPEKAISKRAGVIVGDFAIEATHNSSTKWTNEEEKEQFSPVSVLDFPFNDDDEVSWPFQRRLARMEGTKQKLMYRFENLAHQLEPVDLEKQLSLLSESKDESPESASPCGGDLSVSSQDNMMPEDIEEEENEAEVHRAVDLLEQIKASIPSSSFKFKADNLLLDFLREKITEAYSHTKTVMINHMKFELEMLNVTKDWMSGSPQEMLLEWEVQKKNKNRQAYIREMEKGGRWNKVDEDDEHKEEVAMELEVEVLDSLVNELLLDIFSFSS